MCSKRSNQILTVCVVAVFFGVAGCSRTQQGGNRQERQPPQVVVQTLTAQIVPMTAILPGRTSPYRVALVRPQVSGIILERLFDEGDLVKAEQPLYNIDPAQYTADYHSAEANLKRAQAVSDAADAREKRLSELVLTKSASQQDVEDAQAAANQARAGVAVARAALESVRINLERTVIKAPISGRIGRSRVTEGALVTANQQQELAVITALDPIYVDVVQSSAENLKWKRRMASGELQTLGESELQVKLTLEDGSSYDHEGRLKFAEVQVEETTGAVTLRAVFPNPDHLLLPGMFVRAEVLLGVRHDAILVPQQAVSRNPVGNGIAWVVDARNQAEERTVTTGSAIGNQWLVLKGLAPGDRLVVEGFQHFREGDSVVPVAPQAALAPEQQSAPDAPGSTGAG